MTTMVVQSSLDAWWLDSMTDWNYDMVSWEVPEELHDNGLLSTLQLFDGSFPDLKFDDCIEYDNMLLDDTCHTTLTQSDINIESNITQTESSYCLFESQKAFSEPRSEGSPYDIQQLGDPVASHCEKLDKLSSTEWSTLEREPDLQASPLEVIEPKKGQTFSESRKRKRGSNDTIWSRNIEDDSGKQIGAFISWGPTRGLRDTMDEKQRHSYRRNRMFGACDECKKKKKRCDRSCSPYIQCLNIKPLVFFDKPEQARLFRPRPSTGHPLDSTHKGIYMLSELTSSEQPVTELRISQGLGRLMVSVALFEATAEYKTRHIWKDSTGQRQLQMPPICLTNMTRMKHIVSEFIKSSWCVYLRDIVLRSDPMARIILLEAQKFACSNTASLVTKALKLLAVNRMIELDWTICNSEALGQLPISDIESPWHGKVPVTPVMDTQLDQIIIQLFLIPLRLDLLQILQTRLYSGRKEDWFETFLVVFILCTNTEWLLRHSQKNARRYGARNRYNSMRLAEEYFHGTRILLAHFQHLCSLKPLRLKSKVKANSSEYSLRSHEVDFLQKFNKLVEEKKSGFEELKRHNRYEDEFYWSHQMFVENWTPGALIIKNEIPDV